MLLCREGTRKKKKKKKKLQFSTPKNSPNRFTNEKKWAENLPNVIFNKMRLNGRSTIVIIRMKHTELL